MKFLLEIADVGVIRFGGHFPKADTISIPMAETPKRRRARRRFDDDSKRRLSDWSLMKARALAPSRATSIWRRRSYGHGCSAPAPIAPRAGPALTTADREELSQVRKKNRQLRLEREILKGGLLRKRASDTFALIHARKAIFPITTICHVLGVAPSGYYTWCRRSESAHAHSRPHTKCWPSMRVLLDEQLPRQLAAEIAGHDVATVQQQSWAGLSTGELLKRAATGGFDAFVTADHNLQFQQNLTRSRLFVLVLVAASNALEDLLTTVPDLLSELSKAQPGRVARIHSGK